MKIVDEFPALKLLNTNGIPVVSAGLARSRKEALDLAAKAGYPVVLKISSEKAAHKTEIGGVILDIKNEEECAAAWDTIIEKALKAGLTFPDTLRGISVQPMVKKEAEFIIGGMRDPAFGPVVMFGLGGIYTELYKDVSFRLAPINRREALSMIIDTKAGKILEGFRTGVKIDPADLVTALVKTAELLAREEEIKEIDINPFVVTREGGMALDGLITYF